MNVNPDPYLSDAKFIDPVPGINPMTEPLKIRSGNQIFHYKPKAIVSRYVLGQPVAFTDQPRLPIHYQQHSTGNSNFSKIPVVQTTSQHIPFKNDLNLSRSIYHNIEHDSVLQSRKRTVTFDHRIHHSPPSKVYQPQIPASHVKRQTFDELVIQNTQLRAEKTKLQEENRKLKQSLNVQHKDSQILELQKTITQLSQQILSLKSAQSQDLTKTASTTNPQAFSQIKNQQIYEMFSSCLNKYRLSILQEQKLLIDRYRLQCKNDELNQKRIILQESRKQQYRPRSSYHQRNEPPKVAPSMKENWQNIFHHQSHPKHWRKGKN